MEASNVLDAENKARCLHEASDAAPLDRESGGEREAKQEVAKGKTKGFARSGFKAKERSTGTRSPILDYSGNNSGIDIDQVEEDLKFREGKNIVLFRKCACNSTWCPICGLPAIKARMTEIYKGWDYRYVRSYVLTVDREL